MASISDGNTTNIRPPSELMAMQGTRSIQQPRTPKQTLEDKLRKCLSTKAIKIGKEHGVTAEFIIQQTSEQFFGSMDDLFQLFDCLQDCLYGNDPAVQTSAGKQT